MPDKIKQNTDYGYDIQKVYLEMMLSDAQTFVRCQNIFDHTLFDRRLQTAASGYMRRHPGIKLIVRTVEGGTRVWRVKFVAQEAQ